MIGFLPFYFFTFLPLSAQTPSWAKKACHAVFTLKTFGPDGSLTGSSCGFFLDANGLAASSFTPFKGASRAVVIDAQGREYPVEYLLGANDIYDVAKFQVSAKKTAFLSVAQTTVGDQSAVWLLPYAVKKTPTCLQGTISHAEMFMDQYAYYTLTLDFQEQLVGCPVVNDKGEAIGLLQPSVDNKDGVSYAVSSRFPQDMHIRGLNFNDPVLRLTAVRKGIPDEQNDAVLSLYVSATMMDAEQHADYIERFIQKFPQAIDGYIYRARNCVAQGRFEDAARDMQQALQVADKKDEAHFQYAQMILQKVLYQPEPPYEPWTLERALEESQAAYSANPLPVYRQQQAQINFAQKKYETAYELFMELQQTPLCGAESFYAASQCQQLLGNSDVALALLDSAVNTFTKPYVKTAAPYLLARGQALYEAGRYRPAVNDFNDYESIMSNQLTAHFYYLREQAEMGGHLYQQAINDIRQAIRMAPEEPVYYAERASIELRVGLYDDAATSAEECIRIAPDLSDGYLLLGLVQCIKGQKVQGLQNLKKAKELGNNQAQSLIDKYL